MKKTKTKIKPKIKTKIRNIGPNSPSGVNAELRRFTAIELRRKGLAFVDIGHELGVTKQAAHQMVKQALQECRKDRIDETGLMIEESVQRLDALIEKYWDKATDGDIEAAKFIQSIEKDRRTIYGLDAPKKQDLTANGEPINLQVVFKGTKKGGEE
jgi:predicted transcriptional regulator